MFRYLPVLTCVLFCLPHAAIASSTLLNVPFSTQAPDGVWTQPWQDACEETSIVMVDAFYAGREELPLAAAKEQILRTYRIKTNAFGYSLDENADRIVEWINTFFPWEARVVSRPSLADMKAELDAGRPIILPVHGVELQNPNFRSPLLDYHVVVLTGYDDESQDFFAHDPGTRNGVDFRYSYATIEAAMHDFEPGNMPRARKVAIFTSKEITAQSAYVDGDDDGLTKAEELLYGTILWLSDSDGDGYRDGTEVRMGYSPTRPDRIGGNLAVVVKSPENPKVYRITGQEKQHISSEAAFYRLGYVWQQVRVMPNYFLELFHTGTSL